MTPTKINPQREEVNKATILVTGGSGYIGSHTVISLLQEGFSVIILDNFSNSKFSTIPLIEKINGNAVHCIPGDVRDRLLLKKIFEEHLIDSVIHFAALKSTEESIKNPLIYYDNNVIGLLALLEEMQNAKIKKIVFSSSATVYGKNNFMPISEDSEIGALNPYGQTKIMAEQILNDLYISDLSWSIAILRYFNPVGNHFSGIIGDDPSRRPSNLFPLIARVAQGIEQRLLVYGGDYATRDGTGVRDYIHVQDLAEGHLAALNLIESKLGIFTVNLGTGKGYTVLEMIQAFEKSSGRIIPYQIVDRRPGDIEACYSNPSLAKDLLGWEASRGLSEICDDTWAWISSINMR